MSEKSLLLINVLDLKDISDLFKSWICYRKSATTTTMSRQINPQLLLSYTQKVVKYETVMQTCRIRVIKGYYAN